MARIRTIKPEFFRHYKLYVAEKETRLPLRVAFAGLWTAADREGRFRWQPEELKLDCLPYDDLDFSRVLDALATRGFIEQYTSAGCLYGWIPSFGKHQVINNRERPSELPDPLDSTTSTREARVSDLHVQDQGEREGEVRVNGMEGNGKGASVTRGPSQKQRRRSRSCPDDFVITEEMKEWAIAERPDIDVEYEIKKFRDYEFKDYKQDWGKVFRTWIRNARGGRNGLFPATPAISREQAAMDTYEQLLKEQNGR